MAAVGTGSGTVFAWTALRHINGGLSLRSEKLIGSAPKTIALTYSKNEKRSRAAEKKYTTVELVTMWMNYNNIRSLILIAGTVVGALGLALDPRQ
jgi:hypothetical protein